jgi:hypothetical protein
VSKLNHAVSRIVFVLNGVDYVGSGFFYYDTITDLSKGYFLTAAHNVMTTENGEYVKISEAYIQNPFSNNWFSLDVTKIHIDGVADVALIQTGIDFTNHPEHCLQMYDGTVKSGDPCYIIGNPVSHDEDSFSIGYVRDSNYTDPGGYQIPPSILINAPFIGGNSGGPIVNTDGSVIGICTFSRPGQECFCGGSNHFVLNKTLPILKQGNDNKTKLYLGIDWCVPSPTVMKHFHEHAASFGFGTEGVYINAVSTDSPFHDVLQESDLLLSCQIQNGSETGREILFGRNKNQYSPGVLLYHPCGTDIEIRYKRNKRISSGTNVLTANVNLNVTYNDVSPLLDSYLQTGLRDKTNASILSVNRTRYEVH